MSKNESSEEKKGKTPPATDRQLSTTLIGVISMLAGLGLIMFGGLTIGSIVKIDALTRNAPVAMDSTIVGSLMAVSGLILIIAGFGVWRTLSWAFYLYLAGFLVAIVFMLAFFSTNILAKVGLVVVSAILGALLGEAEYFKGQKTKEDVDVAFLVDFVVYGSMSVGFVSVLLGIAALADQFVLQAGFFENLLTEATGDNQVLSNPLIVGIIVIVTGIVFMVSGYGLSKEMSWAWYVFVAAFVITILVIFLMSPLELAFVLPSLALLLIGLSLGALIANYEYFTN